MNNKIDTQISVSKHTKEPWYQSGTWVGSKTDNECVAFTQKMPDSPLLVERSTENTKRIVACVNACEGYDAVALEAGGIGYFNGAISELIGLCRSRDELLEVTLAMREYIDALPKDLILPAMPGFDRDWADEIIEKCKE